jgi:hypothetical protein
LCACQTFAHQRWADIDNAKHYQYALRAKVLRLPTCKAWAKVLQIFLSCFISALYCWRKETVRMTTAETLVSMLLDNEVPESVDGEFGHFTIALSNRNVYVTARCISPMDATETGEIIRGVWEIVHCHVDDYWA